MIMFRKICLLLLMCLTTAEFAGAQNANLFKFDPSVSPRWSSPENRNGLKGKGAMANFGAKGSPHIRIPAGGTVDLLNIQACGMVNRIWITLSDLSPKTLRALVVQMYWDNSPTPAVSVPIADFFGMSLGKMSAFKNSLFASPEGRSFNCFIPMPFKTAARICLKNEADYEVSSLFFDVDYELTKKWDASNMYFHAYWHRDTATMPGKDFELLPRVTGRGRLLGVNVGVNANPAYKTMWWGEGEVKVYLDGDKEYPTLAGTGTEDYIGDAWGQKPFYNDYEGTLIDDERNLQWSFYRYHIPDPIYFSSDCRMTIQQMGSSFTKEVLAARQNGARLTITSIEDGKGGIEPVYMQNININERPVKNDFAIFYRTDDVCATAYYYLDSPGSTLPELQPPAIRRFNLKAPGN